MTQIKLNLDEDTYNVIKQKAKASGRSATQYMLRVMMRVAGTLPPEPDDPFITYRPGTTTAPAQAYTQTQSIQDLMNTLPDHAKITLTNKPTASVDPELEQKKREVELQKLDMSQEKLKAQFYKKYLRMAHEKFDDSGYWSDEECERFAHDYAYGDKLYELHPDDIIAIKPLTSEDAYQRALDREYEYEYSCHNPDDELPPERTRIVDEWEQEILSSHPDQDFSNEYYQKIKKYFYDTGNLEDFINLTAGNYADPFVMKREPYKSLIYAALGIPADHVLTDAEWIDLSIYFDKGNEILKHKGGHRR